MKFEIKCRFTAKILFETEADSFKIAIEKAVSARANLVGANLVGANLDGANLVGAYLAGANLVGANLARANLVGANLDGANLVGAYLARANLARANLARANLARANLDGANLVGAYFKEIKEDFLQILSIAKNEVLRLYDALMRGKIDGSVYEGECACLVGTIANARNEHFKTLGIDLRPDSNRPAELWFLSIRKGDIPQNNQVSKITAEWTKEFMDKEGIKYPSYEIVAVN